MFNPPHAGHLALARVALTQLALERVFLVPVSVPPHKPAIWDPGADHRAQMCRLASEHEPLLEVCTLELQRPGPSYTVDTLREIHATNPDIEPTLILGADMAATFAAWREPQEIARLARLAVAARPGVDALEMLAPVVELAGSERTEVLEMEPLEISSSGVRRSLAAGESIEPLVGAAVAAYIDEHELYGRQPVRGRR